MKLGALDFPGLVDCEPTFSDPTLRYSLHTQRHDRVDDVIVILLQRLDRLLPTHARLRHHEFDILTLQTGIVHLLIVVFVFFRLLGVRFDGFALALAMVVARVAVGGAGGVSGLLSGELLRGRGLGLRVKVFDLGFAEDAAGYVFRLWMDG